MVRHLTLAATAVPTATEARPATPTAAHGGPKPAPVPDPAAQIDAFWRHIRLKTAVYLAHAHGLPRPQAMEEARRVTAAVRAETAVPDRESALARCLEHAGRLLAEDGRHRPVPLPVAGLPMDPQPLSPVLIAPTPGLGAARLWAMVLAAMVVPALAAALVLI
ncbi:hypothetical protein [Caenispirillum bisanense]|uniref:hypothetical protein n=1 Tax=Caenispirillum bisanense TaxID=414052 RepID=UPI0031D2D543